MNKKKVSPDYTVNHKFIVKNKILWIVLLFTLSFSAIVILDDICSLFNFPLLKNTPLTKYTVSLTLSITMGISSYLHAKKQLQKKEESTK